jgi:hypothetical protein
MMFRYLVPISLIAGLVLRLIFVQDMEYKEDEELNFYYSQAIGNHLPWPWVGMPSGVYIPNPGMSYWIFAVLAKLSAATTPTGLATALQLFSVLGLSLIILFAVSWVKDRRDKVVWLWSFCLTMVNPVFVYYQRKLWPEPFLPFFTMITIMGWWKKDRFWAAFTWGLVGAILGQIHMSGFFFALGLVAWTLFFDRMPAYRWFKGWFAGSVIGALPLVPWIIAVINQPPHEKVVSGISELVQFKFWVFWMSNPFGLHLGNALGLLRSNSGFGQLADFIRYPIVAGVPTYINGVAHLLVSAVFFWVLVQAIRRIIKRKNIFRPHTEGTDLVVEGGFFGFGALLTLSMVNIRRYYLLVATPLETVWMVRMIQKAFSRSKWVLISVWIAQLIISACFVIYIHQNHGSTQGDYGPAYHLVPTTEGLSGRYPSIPKNFPKDTSADAAGTPSN